MKKLLPVHILFSAALTISNANQFTQYVLPYSPPNYPTNYYDDNIFYDPRLNQYSLRHFSNFESKNIPTTETEQVNMGMYVNNNQMFENSANAWPIYTVNGLRQELPQTQIFKDPLVFPSLGFPVYPVNLEMVKETRHEIPTVVPINAYDISFGPSASHVDTATMNMKHRQPHIIFPNRDSEHAQRGDVDKVSPEPVAEVTTHQIKEVENMPETTTTKVKQVSTATLPPVPYSFTLA